MTLEELYIRVNYRKDKIQKESYVSSLFKQGKDRIIQKVGEEATEVIIAAKNPSKKRIVSEIADLLFHLMVLLNQLNIPISDVYEELESRKTKRKPV